MKKRILVIVVIIIMLVMMAAPVSAVVKPPTTVKDALFKGVWGAIMDLQNQITALTQRVDTIENSPMPEYRAGSYTTPSEPAYSDIPQTVTFSHPMPDTNYRVSITSADTSDISDINCDNCILVIDSKTTTGFTFSSRFSTNSNPDYARWINKNHKFDYIAIADN